MKERLRGVSGGLQEKGWHEAYEEPWATGWGAGEGDFAMAGAASTLLSDIHSGGVFEHWSCIASRHDGA